MALIYSWDTLAWVLGQEVGGGGGACVKALPAPPVATLVQLDCLDLLRPELISWSITN